MQTKNFRRSSYLWGVRAKRPNKAPLGAAHPATQHLVPRTWAFAIGLMG